MLDMPDKQADCGVSLRRVHEEGGGESSIQMDR